jgi:DNA-damage-inducible protein J
MSENAIVRARSDEKTKGEASVLLATIGLTVSDAFRLILTRVAREKALPLDPLIPNEEPIAAMKKLGRVACPRPRVLMSDLHAPML